MSEGQPLTPQEIDSLRREMKEAEVLMRAEFAKSGMRQMFLDQAIADLEMARTAPVYTSENGTRFIRVADLPDGLAGRLLAFTRGSAAPGQGCVYLTDYLSFVGVLAKEVARLSIPSIAEQPECVLSRWNVVTFGETFLIGVEGASGRTRTTSAMQSFDMETMVVVTRSGRRYHLQGAPYRDEVVEARQGWPELRDAGLLRTWV